MKRTSLGIMAALLLAIIITSPLHAQRGPSTPEGRARALKLIRHLEAEPLADDAQEARRWLITWGTEIPDITIRMCAEVLKPILAIEDDGGPILTGQFMFSSMGYVIEHPDSMRYDVAVSTGGMEGVLRTYRAMVAGKGMQENKALEFLVEQQKSGKLAAIVAEQVAACKND